MVLGLVKVMCAPVIGLGIMLDDLVAAACTLMVIALWRWW